MQMGSSKSKTSIWNHWNEGGGPKYPHEKVIQFCFRNYPTREDRLHTNALDWGCGSGVHTMFLCAEGFQVQGTDVAQKGIDNTRRRLESAELSASIDLRVEGIQALSLHRHSIDLVICVGVVDCAGIDAAREGLRRLREVLRPKAKGLFLFAAEDDFRVNGNNPWSLHGFTRAEVTSTFQGFRHVWIDSYLTTYRGGLETQHDWLVTLEN